MYLKTTGCLRAFKSPHMWNERQGCLVINVFTKYMYRCKTTIRVITDLMLPYNTIRLIWFFSKKENEHSTYSMLGNICNTNISTVTDTLEISTNQYCWKSSKEEDVHYYIALTWHNFCLLSSKGQFPLKGGTATERYF